MTTASEMPIRARLSHQPVELAKRPKATPGFSACTILKNRGITVSCSHKESWDWMIHLVMRSRRKTAAATAKGRTRSRMRVAQYFIDSGAADGADGGETRMLADVQRVLPAAVTLDAVRPFCIHSETFAAILKPHPRPDEQRGGVGRLL